MHGTRLVGLRPPRYERGMYPKLERVWILNLHFFVYNIHKNHKQSEARAKETSGSNWKHKLELRQNNVIHLKLVRGIYQILQSEQLMKLILYTPVYLNPVH